MPDIGDNLLGVRRRIEAAAARAGRDAGLIELVAVSKTVDAERVQRAVEAGVSDLGENRVQEAAAKIPRVTGPVRWHLLGRLQSNKARRAAGLFDVVHSVDRPSIVQRLDRAAADAGRVIVAYVQVEFARTQATDQEIEEAARTLCRAVDEAPNLTLAGLMTLPPFDRDPETARPFFVRLRELRDEIAAAESLTIPGLSMGMTNDFEIAVEEGATVVRVGTALFGARQ